MLLELHLHESPYRMVLPKMGQSMSMQNNTMESLEGGSLVQSSRLKTKS